MRGARNMARPDTTIALRGRKVRGGDRDRLDAAARKTKLARELLNIQIRTVEGTRRQRLLPQPAPRPRIGHREVDGHMDAAEERRVEVVAQIGRENQDAVEGL